MEQRQHTRVETDRPILLIGQNGQAQGQLVNLSRGGVGVLTPRGAREGTELKLEFEIPAFGVFTPLSLFGKVMHRHNASDQIYLGIVFDHPTTEEIEAIDDFIAYKERLKEMGKRRHSVAQSF